MVKFFQRNGCEDFLTSGLIVWAIAQELGISKSSISDILLKFQSTGSISARPTCGHPRKLQVQKLMRIVKVSVKKIARQVVDVYNLCNLVSVDTTKHIFREQGVKQCIIANKLALWKPLKARLSWLRRYEQRCLYSVWFWFSFMPYQPL